MRGENENKYLGKTVDYPQNYDPSVLVAIPRYENRKQYGIEERPAIFFGFDVWHAYEFSFLTKNGLPVAGVLKIVYASDNLYIVESKSLKLYLNSFNMSRFGNRPEEGVSECIRLIKNDLSSHLGCKVNVEFHNTTGTSSMSLFNFQGLEDLPELWNVSFEHFRENPSLLVPMKVQGEMKVYTDLLRSNCKVTHQPDWGTAFIQMKGKQLPDKIGLLKYIVSLRNENHFHEEICEMIYKRLWDQFSPDELMVTCIYTRRGGIDICPTRASEKRLLPQNLINPKVLTNKLLRQ